MKAQGYFVSAILYGSFQYSRKKKTEALAAEKNDKVDLRSSLPLWSSEKLVVPISSLKDQRLTEPFFYIVYDYRTRSPKYVVEYLTRSSLQSSSSYESKRPNFYPDKSIPSHQFRVNPKDYNDSRYDRGHLAPAADFSAELYKETFTMANISPQTSNLNKGFWARFEAFLRILLSPTSMNYMPSTFDDMLIITGPVYAPSFINDRWVYVHQTIGSFPQLITVPSHFYKIIIGGISEKVGKRTIVVGAYLVPNNNSIDKKTPLRHFMVRLDQLEAIGIYFYVYRLNAVLPIDFDQTCLV